MKIFKNSKLVALLCVAGFSTPALAAPLVNPPTSPLESNVISPVKPNIMFSLDDSGSMLLDAVGDEVYWRYLCKTPNHPANAICAINRNDFMLNNPLGKGNRFTVPDTLYFTPAVNSIYFDPSIEYIPPVRADGTSFGNQDLKNVQFQPFVNPGQRLDYTKVNEVIFCNIPNPSEEQKDDPRFCRRNGKDTSPGNGRFFDYQRNGYPDRTYINKVAGKSKPFYFEVQAKEYCNYNGVVCSATQSAATPIPTKVRWCRTAQLSIQAGVPTGPNTCKATFDETYRFPRIGLMRRVEVADKDLTNYANWFAYYRTRLNAVKTAVGHAFLEMGDDKRIGFISMNRGRALDVADFTPAHKAAFYDILYNHGATGGTNLKKVTSIVGRYFANKQRIVSGSEVDPIQYSCQPNFNILATDGFWNRETNGYDLNGQVIGNVDNTDSADDYSLRSDGVYDGGLAGASGTLSDVALYYYKTPLRHPSLNNCRSGATGENLCPEQPNVPVTASDQNPNLHMNFYGLSFGVNGLMTYNKDYQKGGSVELQNIKSGTSGACSWAAGVCNWPVPEGDKPSALDDLWHATISGRGKYFSARSPKEVVDGIREALNTITASTGGSAAAATSSPKITTTSSMLFSSTYRTIKWDGELSARRIDVNTGNLSPNVLWSARSKLNEKVLSQSDTRNIFFLRPGAQNVSPTPIKFEFSRMNVAERGYFAGKAKDFLQFDDLDSTQKAQANSGENIVKYLRGQTGFSGNLYREREFALGDIVDSSPAFVKGARYKWRDPGYNTFVNQMKSRKAMIYVGANDGMLHAFDADTGEERWAVIPAEQLSKMHLLADSEYEQKHQFFVNGEITIMDAKLNGTWKTVLVTGMGRGGTGYMAIDITSPDSPRFMWEICADKDRCSISDGDMGYSYSNPIITQRGFDGKWVVYVTSGYDSPTGAGIVYELELETGKILRKLIAGSGTRNNQVGLGKLNAYFEDFQKTNKASALFVGDLNGNIWKFDLESEAAGRRAVGIGTASDSKGNVQPITTKLELGKVDKHLVVFAATGRYLNVDDLTSTGQQSLYAIKANATISGLIRNDPAMVKQTITPGTITASSSDEAVDWAVKKGWYFDFAAQKGERVNVDPALVLGNLSVITNVPHSTVCTAGGSSWYYQIDYKRGTAFRSQKGVIAKKLYGSLSVGQTIVMLGDTGILKNYITDAQGKVNVVGVLSDLSDGELGNLEKVNWREFHKRH